MSVAGPAAGGMAQARYVDSYSPTSFAPVLPAPVPAQQVAVKAPVTNDLAMGATMMAGSSPVPPTMVSGGPGSPQQPHYVVTPAQGSPQPPQQSQQPAYLATMQSAPAQTAPSPSNPSTPYGAAPPYGYGAPQQYPMMMAPQMAAPMSQQGTPGLAVAALICGLLGWVPFWIGFILCLLAITFGGIVLAQTRPGQQGRGLAITGLIFGLVLLLPAACGL